MLSDATIYGLSIAGMGLFGLIIKYSFRSKCNDVSLCFGAIHVQRNIEQEIEEQKIENLHPTPSRELSLRNINNV